MASLINYKNIAPQVLKMIQDSIRKKGLVKSGKLLNSIKVIGTSDGLLVSGIDYFEYLDKEYNITKEVFASKDFTDLLMKETLKSIEEDLKKDSSLN